MKNKIKKYRLTLGLSQQDLAQACGVTRETICRIETDRSNPSLELAYHIARRLDTTEEDLFLLDEEIILQ